MNKLSIETSAFKMLPSLPYLLTFAFIVFLQYWAIEWSAKSLAEIFLCERFIYLLIGFFTVLFADFVLLLLTGKIAMSLSVVSVICLILGVTNYYVSKWYGEPFSLEELANAKTAFSVLDRYTFSFEKRIFELFLICILSIFLSFRIFRKKEVQRRHVFLSFLITACLIFASYGGSNPMIPRNAIAWSWDHAIRAYGYIPSFVQQSICGLTVIQKPNSYNENNTVNVADAYTNGLSASEPQDLPDIIIILNETFYDLDQVLDTGISDEVFSCIRSLDNAITGYTLSPKLGGGTNQSEYELLTGNSMYMIPVATPFVSLNLENANTIVSYLEGLGYTTLGTHCYRPSNYSRNRAYPAMGFDHIKWDTDYLNLDEYGDRATFYTDESVYENLTQWYSEISGDKPIFMYCLTIQNHGEWNQNDSEYDIVQTAKDFGAYTDMINEYESCVSLSDRAFKKLIDYYNTVDRDVVIVMVGDHSPSFISTAADSLNINVADNEIEKAMHSTPFIIWSNREGLLHNVVGDNNCFSLFYLAPTVLQAAGIPLSGYYDFLVNMRTEVPIIMKNGHYYDLENNKYAIDQTSEYSELIRQYLAFEYLNIDNPDAAPDFFS